MSLEEQEQAAADERDFPLEDIPADSRPEDFQDNQPATWELNDWDPETEDFQADEPQAEDLQAVEPPAGRAQAGNPGTVNTEVDESNNGSNGEKTTNTVETEPEELKVVLHVRNGRASMGVWQQGTDPHLETFLETDMDILLSELPGVVERAKARWADQPMRPEYNPPKAQRKKKSDPGNQTTQEQSEASTQQTGMARLF